MNLFGEFLILLSCAAFVVGVVFFWRKRHALRLTVRLLALTIAVIVALLLIRVGFSLCGVRPFTWATITEIMQTFSLDADYGVLNELSEHFGGLGCVLVTLYATVLFTTAPIIGGAVIYDVLAGVSPSIKLFFSRRKRLYVFSQLNEAAVTLAEDIDAHERAEAAARAAEASGNGQPAEARDGSLPAAYARDEAAGAGEPAPGGWFGKLKAGFTAWRRGLLEELDERAGRAYAIVFTDLAGPPEEDAELLERAHEMGAICLGRDVTNIRDFRHSRRCSYFLMEQDAAGFNDVKNLERLSLLVSEKNSASWEPDQGPVFYFFTDDSETIENVRALKSGYDVRPKRGERDVPITVRVVRTDALTCCQLLRDTPLFAPLGVWERGKDLRVALYGGGAMAREMFRTLFWCGQMLDIPLHIAVVSDGEPLSDGAPAAFEGWVERLNPELLASCRPGDDCLRIWADESGVPEAERRAAPYCALDFIQLPLDGADLYDLVARERTEKYGGGKYRLAQCDYSIVCLGDDQQNLRLTAELRRQMIYILDRMPALRAGRGAPVIALEMLSGEMTALLTDRFERREWADVNEFERKVETRVVPFGSYRERFSWNNAFLDEMTLANGKTHSGAAPGEHEYEDSVSTRKAIYDFWSNVARAFHFKYKEYSAWAYWSGAETLEGAKIGLRWLEKRRWNAFLRSQGFRCAFEDAEELLAALREWDRIPVKYGYKDILIRRHPCLVECARGDTWPPEEQNEKPWTARCLQNAACPGDLDELLAGHDLLDAVTLARGLSAGAKKVREGDAPDLTAGATTVKRYDLSDGELEMMLEGAPKA